MILRDSTACLQVKRAVGALCLEGHGLPADEDIIPSSPSGFCAAFDALLVEQERLPHLQLQPLILPPDAKEEVRT